MRMYSDTITLNKNSRGVYSLDTIIGCTSGTVDNLNGCYGDCYAARGARRYGYDFRTSVRRYFKSERHRYTIAKQIERIPLPFVRIGTMGDPSEDWGHTINICSTIRTMRPLDFFRPVSKEIVIITRHWNTLTDSQMIALSKMNVCINTSVSALDSHDEVCKMLHQYERIKPYCKSVLRIISCDFNKSNPIGIAMSGIQEELFNNHNVIDTVFRPSLNNPFVTKGIINIKREVFNGKKQWASKFKRKTYMGKCSTCLEMCGATFKK